MIVSDIYAAMICMVWCAEYAIHILDGSVVVCNTYLTISYQMLANT